MSKPVSSSSKHRHRSSGGSHAPQRVSDIGPYVAFLLIWVFVSFVAYITAREMLYVISLGLVAACALYVTLCTSRAYAGRSLAQWQKGLVRLPLVLVGAGTLRVIDAKGDSRARIAIVMWAILSVVLVALTLWQLKQVI